MSQHSRPAKPPPLAQPYLPAQPLPRPNPFPSDQDLWQSAYSACLDYEERAREMPQPKTKPRTVLPLIYARVLGCMLYFSPTNGGRDSIAREVLSCQNRNDSLAKLAELYMRCFLRCFKSASGPTPAISPHSSRTSFEDYRQTLNDLLEEAPRSHATAKKLALSRDGYRCMLTGKYDSGSVDKMPWLQEILSSDSGVAEVPTHCAHIIPESINQQISNESIDYAASVWEVLDRFGQVDVKKELSGADIHRLENVMTVEVNSYTLFDKLSIWLEETDVPNQYRFGAVRPSLLPHPEVTTFRSSDDRLPLPDPRYLRLHAVCAQVTHFSGAGEYLDSIFRDLEEMRVLSKDGSSAEVLTFALMNRTGVVV